MRDESIPLFFSDQFLEVVQECETFLVGDAAEGVVGVFAFEVDDEFGEFVVFAELLNRVGEGFPADYGGEVAMGLAVTTGGGGCKLWRGGVKV